MIYWCGWDLWALNPFGSSGASLKDYFVKAAGRNGFRCEAGQIAKLALLLVG